MADKTNSVLLDAVMEISKHVGKRESPLPTAERIIVAFCKVLSGEYKAEAKDEVDAACECARSAGIDISALSGALMEYIDTTSEAPYMADLYVKKKLKEAQNLAEKNSRDFVGLDLLLQCIFSDPTGAIKKALGGDEPKNGSAAAPAGESKKEECAKTEPGSKAPEAEKQSAPAGGKAQVAELTKKVKELRATLLESVMGQDNAVNIFVNGYFQAEMLTLTDKERTRPRATYLFAGPPGVGKTFLAESAAKALGLPFKRFDMSEYAMSFSSMDLVGSQGGKPGVLTRFVKGCPKCVILFDEVEKAHLNIIHHFLQVLDAGRLTDASTNDTVSFKDAILIFTTNAGKQLYETSDSGDFSDTSRKVILGALQNDINPMMGVPYFPAAICSRFASGNVVMFNHMSAHHLRKIAKKEVLRHARNFRAEVGIDVNIAESVFSTILFAEGGAADARTVRGRAEAFFDSEIFELFRLVNSEKVKTGIEDIEDITIDIDLPEGEGEITELYHGKDTADVLVFAPQNTVEACRAHSCGCDFHGAQSVAEATEILKSADVDFAMIEFGRAGGEYLNIEDESSAARDFFQFVREHNADLPVYLLTDGGDEYSSEEVTSFLRQGARGVISLADGAEPFGDVMGELCEMIDQQKAMSALARANKALTYESAQTLSEDGKHACIKLFDFALDVAVSAEDSGSVLSGVSKPTVKFADVIGASDAKEELAHFTDYLKNPKKYMGTGARAPRGVLLYGPPGTGKTLLAKAMAGECDVTYIAAEGNQFLKKYVGEGPEKVHELFRVARKYAPSILFIDEIDAVAKERTGADNSAGRDEVLTAFLTEMDGFKNDPARPVFVLAATNYSVEPGNGKSIDGALLRRFDRRLFIDLPKREDRVRYLKMKTADANVYSLSDEQIESIAVRSTGMSLASLESVLDLAMRMTLREGSLKVTDSILDEAFETFNSGEKKDWDISQLERVARHEAGHAFLYWHSGQTPSYITVVARGDHGGYMQHADNEGKAIYTKDELLSVIRTSLGGRAAEILYYGREQGISTGAGGDLQSATARARALICSYGMDDAFGLAVIDPAAAQSGELSVQVREAVNAILAEQTEEAVRILAENKDKLDALVSALLEKNHLTGKELEELFSEQ